VETFRPEGARVDEIVPVKLFIIMEFLRRKTLLTVAVVLMVLLVGEAHVVEGLPAKEVKEPTPKLDKSKEEPQLKEEAAPVEKTAKQGEGGEASAGEDEKKGGEETSNLKSGGSSFVSQGSSTSSSPPVGNPEIPPPGKQKPTESNKTAQSEDSALEKVDNVKPKVAKLEEQSSSEGKEVVSQEKPAKGPNPDPIPNELPAVDGEISEKEDHVMDVNEEDADAVKEESKVDTPLETSFEKQMGSGAPDPPQTNFFSYFIVLAIITIIAYLVFHNKKKILGLIVEGRSGKQAGRRRSGGREYRKLDSNMEDMMETGKETSMRQVIY